MPAIKAFQGIFQSTKIYTPADIDTVLELVTPYMELCHKSKGVQYFNAPCAFDIETTSFFRTCGNGEQEKCATMYEWTLGIYGAVIIGRTWDEYLQVLHRTSDVLSLSADRRLCVYVHNLAFEFQFLRKWLKWDKVFSLDNRKPVYAVSDIGVEFRCSYILSGYSLAKLGDNLHTYKVRKLVGELDYTKPRHSNTPLTEQETAYCVNDVKVVMAHIAECIESDKELSHIPLTNTGYVRKYCRASCFTDPLNRNRYKRFRYMEQMQALQLCPDEYKQLKRAFQGGFTHANPFYAGKVVTDVTSFDFTSSYPAVMLSERFPMSTAELVDIRSKEDFITSIKYYCCLFDVEITGLQSQLWHDSYLSLSRCWGVVKPVVNNGRVVSAERLYTTLTEQDYLIMRRFYKWDSFAVANFRRYIKGYLPTDFVKAILKLYGDKTTLKGVEGKEVEYLKSKGMLNSCYGMAVTDIVRPEYLYTDDWQDPVEPEISKALLTYNTDRNRFLFYPWGVWVTAYARRNLFSGIIEFGSDYIYSDTDSVKVINADKHTVYIDDYNRRITAQLYRAMDYHRIDRSAVAPLTTEGVVKPLGVWDFDGHYSRFKTLGAKRYIVEYSADDRNSSKLHGKVSITVSGLNKQTCIPYMLDKWGKDNIFDHFANNMYIPAEYTGKMTHTYIDDPIEGVLVDYLGVPGKFMELSCVHLANSDYSLSISREYADYLAGLETIN